MNNKTVILIGRSAAGKTTFCQRINEEDIIYHKTQTIQVVNGSIIDTPGEYLERARLRGALTVASVDADLILLVQDATENGTMFPPAYASSFAKPAIGLVTKEDIATEAQVAEAVRFLEMAGAERVFVISSITGTGFGELFQYLNFLEKKEEK
ncbi:MAG TPA: EutP/PduV family microcompartment system protein [Clostridiales bacterium]|nr:EutP/PduV family microcompartment system protein [Clostridiales bacterium]